MYMYMYVHYNCQARPLTFSTALALHENTTITHLNLRSCGIGADGWDQLSTCLKNKANLQHLDLSYNEIGSLRITNLGIIIYKLINSI